MHGNVSLKKHPESFRRQVSFAEAEPVFPQFLTGAEMISLFKVAKNGTSSQQNYLIESMGMKHYVDEQLGSYSSGMLKKLSLILAFIGNCEIISLDEPLTTLDSDSLTVLHQWIIKRQHTTFLLASHQSLKIAADISIKQLIVESQTINFLA